jgi:tetratricopeptide (TPR) repeat protein
MTRNPGFGILAAATLAVAVSAALAAGGGGGGGSNLWGLDQDKLHAQPDYQAGVAAVSEQRWADAIQALQRHVSRNYRDADGHNYLAYSLRKSGRLDEAFKHYKLALTFNPKHLGAHEYIGEAYVMAGQPAEARKHLEQLAALCGTQCEQYKDLAEAIERNRVSSAK